MTDLSRNEIVFVLDNLSDWQTLVAGLPTGVEVHVLDAKGDGLKQMVSLLEGRTGLDAIHLFSHGSDGALQLGSFSLNAGTLQTYADDLTRIGRALNADGDILLYGCNVGAGETGVNFIGKVAQLTGADVAASDDLTGAGAQGGNWVLESVTGVISAGGVVDQVTQSNYAGLLVVTGNFIVGDGSGGGGAGKPGNDVNIPDSGIRDNLLHLICRIAAPGIGIRKRLCPDYSLKIQKQYIVTIG